jgi:hypothetical protein
LRRTEGLGAIVCSAEDAAAWLTDRRWIVLSYDGDFSEYLENCYFKPGTPKNAEFEALISPVAVDGQFGVAAFCRIRDTVENREAYRAALAEFYQKRLLSLAELDRTIENLRREIRQSILPMVR